MVIWLIGISGAGKTTLGNKLKEYLDSKNRESYVIDGNLIRDFFDNDFYAPPCQAPSAGWNPDTSHIHFNLEINTNLLTHIFTH